HQLRAVPRHLAPWEAGPGGGADVVLAAIQPVHELETRVGDEQFSWRLSDRQLVVADVAGQDSARRRIELTGTPSGAPALRGVHTAAGDGRERGGPLAPRH